MANRIARKKLPLPQRFCTELLVFVFEDPVKQTNACSQNKVENIWQAMLGDIVSESTHKNICTAILMSVLSACRDSTCELLHLLLKLRTCRNRITKSLFYPIMVLRLARYVRQSLHQLCTFVFSEK